MQIFLITLTQICLLQLVAWLFGLDSYATPIKVVALGAIVISATILNLTVSFETRFDILMNHLKR